MKSDNSIDIFEKYESRLWTTPEYYGGYDPVGDLVIAKKHRDSRLIISFNFDSAYEMLKELNGDSDNVDDDVVYIHRVSCNLFGWHEYLLVRQGAGKEIQKKVGGVIERLNNSEILDEEGYYSEVSDLWEDYWGSLDEEEKSEMIEEIHKETGLNKEDCVYALQGRYSEEL